MNKLLKIQSKVQKFEASFSGVFTFSDLKNLISAKTPLALQRQIKELQENKIIFSFVRGLYVTSNFNLEVVSQRLCRQSYLSFGTVLAKELIIGTIPQKTVYAVKIGKSRIYESEWGKVVHLGITPTLFWGYKTVNGLNWADKEKAVLDTLYFYQKGTKFHFNIYEDINFASLDQKKFTRYLKLYSNPRFQSFVKGRLND